MPRILHIYKNYHPIVGGIENHIKSLAEAEARRGDDVTVLVANTTTRTERTIHEGVRVIKAARAVEIASTPLSPAMLWEAAGIEADIINLHMPFPPGDLLIHSVQGNPALVVSYHSDVVRQQHMLRLYRPLLEQTLGSAGRIIVGSKRYRDSSPFLGLHAAKCRVVPYAVDATRFSTLDNQELDRLRQRWRGPVILSVGVLRYYKGLHILIAAMRELDATLVIVGGGPEEIRLRALVDEAGLAGRIHFVGRVADEDLPSYYQAADIFVLASHLRAEAFGIVLLEAMAAGLPLVTTEIGTATSEINRHGLTGFVVPPNDAPALARALQALMTNRDLREYLGQQGRRLALEEHSVADMADGVAAVYREALAAHSP